MALKRMTREEQYHAKGPTHAYQSLQRPMPTTNTGYTNPIPNPIIRSHPTPCSYISSIYSCPLRFNTAAPQMYSTHSSSSAEAAAQAWVSCSCSAVAAAVPAYSSPQQHSSRRSQPSTRTSFARARCPSATACNRMRRRQRPRCHWCRWVLLLML